MGTHAHGNACTCREHPLPATMSVREGRDAYLRENGFTVAAYDDPWTKASFFGIPISIPNTKRHRWAIMLHDLHHVVTGYGTDIPGEAEISAWETRRGLGSIGLYVAAIVASITATGAVLSPRRTIAAFRASGRHHSLFDEPRAYDVLLDMTVGDLRKALHVPIEGLATRPRALHPDAPRAPMERAAAS
jgi:hypothetical protein